MCGIIGIVSKKNFTSKELLGRLKRLEYRGYDSYGFYDGNELKKSVGEIQVSGDDHSKIGIAHTRWATHGGVTEINAHPHMSTDKNIVIVHNGIIENFMELKKKLEKKGHKFVSQTDSEVVAHYFEDKLKKNNVTETIKDFFREVEGTFAILLMIKGKHEIYALKRDSPLALGICKDNFMLASDIYAFSDITTKAIFFENDEYAIIREKDYEFFDKNSRKINKPVKEFEWKQKESDKEQYKHYMLKEIHEEPEALERLLFSLDNDQKEEFEKLINLIKSSKKIIFAACGTSYHSSLLGAYYLHKAGVQAQTLIASEFKYFANIDKNTLVIAITQSGETMDVIDAIKYAQEQGAVIVSFVNVPYSSIQRMSKLSINLLAGQEVSVASTKAFVNQSTLLLKIAQTLGFPVNITNLALKLKKLFLDEEKIKKIAYSIAKTNDLYVIGRGLTYPVSREISLKIKEISYIHAEGMMGGELKHGTLALIEDNTPVISIINNDDPDMISNTKEVEARGANMVIISNTKEFKEQKNTIYIDTGNDGKFGILAATAGQLLAYHIADSLGRPIDKPRNLAKICTTK